MQSLCKLHQRLDKILTILLKNIDLPDETVTPTPLLLPTPWISSGLGLIGSSTEIKQHGKTKDRIILNLNSRKLSYKNKSVILEKPYVVLFSFFASTGNSELPIESIKQLDLEIDLIKREYKKNAWRAQKDDTKYLETERLNRLNVTKNRLNKKLKSLGIRVITNKGNWQITLLNEKYNLSINLIGTPYSKTQEQEKISIETPKNLTKTQKIIWNYFIKRHSAFISAHAIAIEINAPNKSTKQISDIMYKFKKKLKNSPFQLIRSYQGEYMLINS